MNNKSNITLELQVLNDDFLSEVGTFEGFRRTSYLCPAGKWTIGFGHTKNVIKGMTCSYAQALAWLLEDMSYSFNFLYNIYGDKLSVGTYKALCDFVYNCGSSAFMRSTLKKLVDTYCNEKPLSNIAKQHITCQLLLWNKCKGKELRGLTKRREFECNLLF